MGLYLTLLPLWDRKTLEREFVFCGDSLTFDQDHRIDDQLDPFGTRNPMIPTNQIPMNLWVEIYEDEGIRKTRTDSYDRILRFAFAQGLKGLDMPADASSKNKAIKALIDALSDDVPIILFWH